MNWSDPDLDEAISPFGRRFVVQISLLLQLVAGVGSAFSPNIYVYIALRFLSGASTSGVIINVYVLGAEWTGTSKRALFIVIPHTFYSVGLMMLSGVAYGIRNWRIMHLVLFSPIILSFGLFHWVLPESARWLMTQGRKEEARQAIRKAAGVNRRKVPEALLDKLEVETTPEAGSILDLFRVSYLRKCTISMGCIWFAISVVYYGLSLNVGNFGLDIYLTQFIFGIVEVPARLGSAVIIDHFGRRICLIVTLVCGGATCLSILAIPKGIL
ncbi:solute carrier family 22 member 13-like [Lampris incognitus]|uniref:solute carrier family 22 member 13-like n=1 Tax=Lampris incognitus TaxID=2546036 RepID=UPI0024B4E5F4|nr:solute carrier family 22 member 13-like [Lampris incognitus]